MARRALARAFAWSLTGNFLYNMSQWVLVVVLARMGTKEMVGQFAFAQALAAPIYLTVGLNLRVVRATDVRRIWAAHQYRALRILLNAVSIALAIVIGAFVGLRDGAILVLLMVCLGKASEATSQTLYGFFQIRDRLDLVSRSLLLRALLGSVGFVLALALGGGLIAATAGLALGWFVVYLGHDLPGELRLLEDDEAASTRVADSGTGTWRSLARKAAPLGVDAGVGSLATNAPRYGVQHILGSASLGAYAALAYLGLVVAMVTGSLADSVIGRLARLADRRDVSGYVRTLFALVGFGAAVSLVCGLGAWLLGEPVIRLLLGPEYVNQPVLILLMVSAAVTTVQRCLGRGLQAAHRYTWVMVVDIVTLVGTMLAAAILIPWMGLPGAAATLSVGFGLGAVVAVAMLVHVARTMQAPPPSSTRAAPPARLE